MFYEKQPEEQKENYKLLLSTIGAISNLFANTTEPYLDYRVVENIFCKAFKCENLSRLDCSVDASKDKTGIGIKTFLHKNGKTMQKVAEFNDKSSEIKKIKDPVEKVKYIAYLRNERIRATEKIHGLEKSIYHCITRLDGKFYVYECNMDTIAIDKISSVKATEKSISFKDNKNDYVFNLSKSVLMKRFIVNKILEEIPVEIVKDPYQLLLDSMKKCLEKDKKEKLEVVYLPLYSVNKGGKYVPEKSGLNLWNANGRKRKSNEVYIRIPEPSKFHDEHKGFFPGKDKTFELQLPDGNVISAKICQGGDKALMSNPNTALGEWILRGVLQLKEYELATYERLSELGIDSVAVTKIRDLFYKIDFINSETDNELNANYE